MASKRDEAKSFPLIEWISAAIGLVVTIAMLTVLVFEAMEERRKVPPVLQIEPIRLVSAANGYILEFKAKNLASATAASVAVEGVLLAGTSEVERSSVTLSYVPGKSHQRGGLVFTEDPRKYRLELRATGYERP